MRIQYKEIVLPTAYRMDLLVENKIVVELKAIDFLADVHIAQVLTYLKFSKMRVGLILNFNVPKMTQGIKRIVR